MTTGPNGPQPPHDQPPHDQPPRAQPQYGQPSYPQPPQPPYGGQGSGGQPTGWPGHPAHPAPRPLRPEEERLWAIAAHLGPLVLGFVAPLLVWLVFRERSAFLDRTGKEALNMQVSYLIYATVSGLSILLLVGLALFPLVMLAWFVLMVVATVKVASWEDYRYPAIIRFVR